MKLYATPSVYVGKRLSQDLKTPLKQVLPGPSVLWNEHRVSIQAAFADAQNPLKADNLSEITLTLLLSCLWFVYCLTGPHTHRHTNTHFICSPTVKQTDPALLSENVSCEEMKKGKLECEHVCVCVPWGLGKLSNFFFFLVFIECSLGDCSTSYPGPHCIAKSC